MSPVARQQIHEDLELIERFSSSYGREFSSLIRELNADPTPQTGRKSLRLCVEAVNMLLDSQKQLAAALRSLSES